VYTIFACATLPPFTAEQETVMVICLFVGPGISQVKFRDTVGFPGTFTETDGLSSPIPGVIPDHGGFKTNSRRPETLSWVAIAEPPSFAVNVPVNVCPGVRVVGRSGHTKTQSDLSPDPPDSAMTFWLAPFSVLTTVTLPLQSEVKYDAADDAG